MNIYRAKCETCGETPYIFPDQIEKIKLNPQLKMYPYVKGALVVGSKWFCIKCDASKKDGSKCKIIATLSGDKAERLLKIRKRETDMLKAKDTLKSKGFYLPN